MASSTWETHELPILEAIAARAGVSSGPDSAAIIEAVRIPKEEGELALERLRRNGYIDAIEATSFGGYDLLNIQLLEPGLRVVGVWPRDPYEEFLAVIGRRIAAEPDEARRGRLERLRDAVTAVGTDVATGVIAEVVKSSLHV